MLYISIDVETTGLDPERNQVLSIGAIIEDTEKKLPFESIPKFHAAILHNDVRGSLFALNMNKGLIENIVKYIELQKIKDESDRKKAIDAHKEVTSLEFYEEDQIIEEFFNFLFINGISNLRPEELLSIPRKYVSGKMIPCLTSKMTPTTLNVAGKNFASFDKLFLERLPRWKQCIRIRQRIIDPAILFIDWKNDQSLPGLGDCKKRAAIDGIVSHNAIEDAWDVICLLRKYY